MSQEGIVLKTRDAVVLACIGGVCVGFGAFSIFHYLTAQKKQQQSIQKRNSNPFQQAFKQQPSQPSQQPAFGRLARHYSVDRSYLEATIAKLDNDNSDELKGLEPDDQIKALKEKTYQLVRLLYTHSTTLTYCKPSTDLGKPSDHCTLKQIRYIKPTYAECLGY